VPETKKNRILAPPLPAPNSPS